MFVSPAFGIDSMANAGEIINDLYRLEDIK